MEEALVGDDWWKIEPETKHIRASEAKALYWEHWDEYLTFSFTRPYYDRHTSFLNRFCVADADAGTKPTSWWIDEPLDFVGRFSHLQEDWNTLCALLGVEIELPHLR